jgi:predicted MFS family arabinose efflux permease
VLTGGGDLADRSSNIMIIASAVLLATFVALESRARHPLLPLRILADRARGGSYLAVGTSAPAMFTATYNVPPADAGVASAIVNTMQQAGGAIGASGLSTIFARAVSSYLHAHSPSPPLTSAAAVQGYTTAFWGRSRHPRRPRDPRRLARAEHQNTSHDTQANPRPPQPTPRHSRERRSSLSGRLPKYTASLKEP